MQLSKNRILILGFILWPLIIAIPQFNLNYSPGLLAGKLNYGEIPPQFYLGLISGLFAALIFWGISILLAKIFTKARKKEIRGSITYFYVTLFFFAFMLITQGKNFYIALTLDEEKVKEARELIKQYDSKLTSYGSEKHDYPSYVTQNFMSSCQETSGGDQKTCSCLLDKIQEKYTYEEFLAIDIKMQAGQTPQEFLEFVGKAREECSKK